MTEKNNWKEQWQLQLEQVKHHAEDPDTPDGVKEILNEWLAPTEYYYGFVRMATGEIHTTEEHEELNHNENDCYEVKLSELN